MGMKVVVWLVGGTAVFCLGVWAAPFLGRNGAGDGSDSKKWRSVANTGNEIKDFLFEALVTESVKVMPKLERKVTLRDGNGDGVEDRGIEGYSVKRKGEKHPTKVYCVYKHLNDEGRWVSFRRFFDHNGNSVFSESDEDGDGFFEAVDVSLDSRDRQPGSDVWTRFVRGEDGGIVVDKTEFHYFSVNRERLRGLMEEYEDPMDALIALCVVPDGEGGD